MICRAVYFALFGNFCSGIVSDFSIFRKGFKNEKLFWLKIVFWRTKMIEIKESFELLKTRTKFRIKIQNISAVATFEKSQSFLHHFGSQAIKSVTVVLRTNGEQVLLFIQNTHSREGRKLPKHYVKFPNFSSIACINVGSFSMSFGCKIFCGLGDFSS